MLNLSLFSDLFFGNLVFVIGVFLTILFSVFLFWREGRRELVDSHVLFDSLVTAAITGFFASRLFAFVFDYKEFNFSLTKLIFFHLFPSYSFYGATVGFLIGGALALKNQKTKIFWLFDLAAPALAFGQAFFWLSMFIREEIVKKTVSFKYLEFFAFYLLLYWILKRLFSKKRHIGYFSGFYLVSVGLINSVVLLLNTKSGFMNFDYFIFVQPLAFIIFGFWAWIILAKRNLKKDIWNFFALMLLGVFRFKRFISSLDEAGIVSKTIIFSPYFLFKFFLLLLKKLFGEIKISFFDFLYALGVKNK